MKNNFLFACIFFSVIIFSSCRRNPISSMPPPVASFTLIHNVTPPYSVSFTNTSTLVGASYVWLFGDGNQSSELNPTHVYNSSGLYVAKLVQTKGANIDTLAKLIHVSLLDSSITTPSSLSFDFKIAESPPFKVTFTNTSTNASSCIWNFGDSTSLLMDTTTHIIHEYAKSGCTS